MKISIIPYRRKGVYLVLNQDWLTILSISRLVNDRLTLAISISLAIVSDYNGLKEQGSAKI